MLEIQLKRIVMDALKYETLLCHAFNLGLERDIKRGDDPGGLADTDIFCNETIDLVKIGVGYSINIINNKIKYSDQNLEKLIKKVIDASTIEEIIEPIEYCNKIIKENFIEQDGILKAK